MLLKGVLLAIVHFFSNPLAMKTRHPVALCLFMLLSYDAMCIIFLSSTSPLTKVACSAFRETLQLALLVGFDLSLNTTGMKLTLFFYTCRDVPGMLDGIKPL